MTHPLSLDDYDTADDLYRDVEKLIWSICHKFARRHGGDVHEYFADAGLFFMRALDAYDAEKGSFSTLLTWHVWGGLMDALRTSTSRNKILPRASSEVLYERSARRSFDILRFKRELSTDAALVVHLSITMPGELAEVAKASGVGLDVPSGRKAPADPAPVRSAITEWLIGWGWSMQRITECYGEITQALS